MCIYCKMSIIDPQHSAELVTLKGKAFTFDAIECMVDYININTETNYAFLMVADYLNPGQLIDAQNASFLISEAVPSPMGAFLSAFGSEQNAAVLQDEKGGEIYHWEALLKLRKK